MNVHDRSAKVARRRAQMPVNGIAMKRLLNERAARAQADTKIKGTTLFHMNGACGINEAHSDEDHR